MMMLKTTTTRPGLGLTNGPGAALALPAPCRSSQVHNFTHHHLQGHSHVHIQSHAPCPHPSNALRTQSRQGTALNSTSNTSGAGWLSKPGPDLLIEALYIILELMVIDAAFSGDWSRIGVITKDIEIFLQQFVVFGVVAHLGTAAACVKLGAERGVPALLAAFRGFVFGAFGTWKISKMDVIS